MNDALQRILRTEDSPWFILIRIMVGAVFVSEGIQKFLYPAYLGAGRFERIGIPAPEIMGPFVGFVEIAAGTLLLLGLFTRFAAVALAIIMCVAIFTTKIPILLGTEFLGFSLRDLSRYGFFSMAHEMRTDWSMLIGSIFLLLAGGGRWSLDRRLLGEAGQRVDRAVPNPGNQAPNPIATQDPR